MCYHFYHSNKLQENGVADLRGDKQSGYLPASNCRSCYKLLYDTISLFRNSIARAEMLRT